MPARNADPYIDAAVSSVLDQTANDLELNIIDDHSEDGAARRLRGTDPRLKVINNAGHGLVPALNTGIESSLGRWIARMDADDICHPDRLRTQLDYARDHPDVDIVGTQVEMFRDDGPIDPGYANYEAWINALVSHDDIEREIYVESPIPHPTALIKRDVLLTLGGYRDTPWAEDYDLWLRAWQAGHRFGKPAGILLRWRDHGARASRTQARYAAEQFVAARACYLARDKRLEAGVFICGAGKGGKALCDALLPYGVKVHGFIDVSPRRIGGMTRQRPVKGVDEVSSIDQFILIAVGTRGMRASIRSEMRLSGKTEGRDFVFAL